METFWAETHGLVRLLERPARSGPPAPRRPEGSAARPGRTGRRCPPGDPAAGRRRDVRPRGSTTWTSPASAARGRAESPSPNRTCASDFNRRPADHPPVLTETDQRRGDPVSVSADENPGGEERRRNQGRMALAVLAGLVRPVQGGATWSPTPRCEADSRPIDVEPNWRRVASPGRGTRSGTASSGCPPRSTGGPPRDRQAGRRAEAWTPSVFADRLARMADGAAGQWSTGFDPGEIRTEGLARTGPLLWQAQRTYDDRWYAEDPAADALLPGRRPPVRG